MRNPRLGVPWSRGRLRRRGQYATYMASAQWRARRATWRTEWLDRYGIEPICLVCGARWTLRHGDLHHRSYDRLGAERFGALVPLCRADHTEMHNLWDACPAWRYMGRSAATIGIIAALRRRENPVQQREADDHAC